MSNPITIYHNPRCSKSRQTLKLIEDAGIQPEIVLYLETPPNKTQIETLLRQLNIAPRDLLRKGEEEYKNLGLKDLSLSDEALIDAMVKHPRLIERPIVTRDEKAVLGRPPENVETLL